ncbi:hypothetical protein TRFO_10434 [Tritrichomonas foetus]|uniref:Uncharacterized protein n=1 Tax=Tritrichomonas foetus TaxID=1144522 RepID=A0A1J4JA50_9EUKA|nr:hypothetical protein TRFO_10434 [Tritrichomonas foetus]|eukprot:OHS95545.1 hypothetical protein TRFO_10434 [Tritrichomonas foetus]
MITLNLRIFKSMLLPRNATVEEYLAPLFKYAPKHVSIKQSDEPLKKGEPLLGFCLTGGTEAPFLQAALENPENPAIILVHNRANSYASGCELAARLNYEHKIGKRAPCVFCSINDEQSVKSIIGAAATASSFAKKHPNLGVIGDPSPWLIASGYFAEKLPGMYNIDLTKIKIEELVQKSVETNVETALEQIVKNYNLDAFTVRCFDLLPHKITSCLEVSKFNDKGITAGCEGDIASATTMMIIRSMAQSPVFMANATGFEDGKATFAHCTIPRTLCTDSTVDTHYESGLGHAVCGRVKEGQWTLAKLGANGDLMTEVVDVKNPSEISPHHCRTQIVVTPPKRLTKKLQRGEVLGNHFLFVPGNIRDELRIFSEVFKQWKPIQ